MAKIAALVTTLKQTDWQTWVAWSGGFCGCTIATLLAWDIFQGHTPVNGATWLMVLVLDALGLFLLVKAGHHWPPLQIGWTVAATLIFAAVLYTGQAWAWGVVEYSSIAGCLCAALLYFKGGKAIWALYAYLVATYISIIPQAVDYWQEPRPETLYIWVWSATGCALALIGLKREERDQAHMLVPAACLLLNSIMAILVLR